MGFCKNCNIEVDSKFCPNCGTEVISTSAKETENEKEAILDRLYALRAGLSKVSIEVDKVSGLETRLKNLKDRNSAIIQDYHNENGNYQWFKKCTDKIVQKHNSYNQEIQKKINDAEKTIESNNRFIKDKKKIVIIFSLISAFFFCLSAYFVIALYFNLFDYYRPGQYLPSIVITGIIYAIFSLILRSHKKEIFSSKKNIEKFKKTITSLKSQLQSDDYISMSINNDPEYIEMSAKFHREEEAFIKAKNYDFTSLNNSIDCEKNNCAVFYDEFYGSYLSTFKDVIDERDWKNLDLIIFMLETKRANNLQEALQQVDLYRSTEMIAKIIVSATNTICDRISREANKISFAIQNSIDSINNRLESIAESQNRLNESINAVNSSIKESISVTELQNALIQKSNITSEQMANDIEQIKNFAGRSFGHI